MTEKRRKISSPKPSREIARDNNKLDDKELITNLAKKMISPCYFTDREEQVGFNITLESHHINHTNSKLNIKRNFPELGTETRYNNKILKEMATTYATSTNQYKFN